MIVVDSAILLFFSPEFSFPCVLYRSSIVLYLPTSHFIFQHRTHFISIIVKVLNFLSNFHYNTMSFEQTKMMRDFQVIQYFIYAVYTRCILFIYRSVDCLHINNNNNSLVPSIEIAVETCADYSRYMRMKLRIVFIVKCMGT